MTKSITGKLLKRKEKLFGNRDLPRWRSEQLSLPTFSARRVVSTYAECVYCIDLRLSRRAGAMVLVQRSAITLADAKLVGDRRDNPLPIINPIQVARLVWPVQDQESARTTLRVTIKRMVVEPLVDFGILVIKYEPQTKYGIEFLELSTIQLTPFGKGLLGAIREAMK